MKWNVAKPTPLPSQSLIFYFNRQPQSRSMGSSTWISSIQSVPAGIQTRNYSSLHMENRKEGGFIYAGDRSFEDETNKSGGKTVKRVKGTDQGSSGKKNSCTRGSVASGIKGKTPEHEKLCTWNASGALEFREAAQPPCLGCESISYPPLFGLP